MAYNHGKEERKWRIWKEAEEKTMRDCGVDENTIEKIRTYDREVFNSDRRFYQRVQESDTYLDTVTEKEWQVEVCSVGKLLDEIENMELYCKLLTVDRLTLQIVLMKMQGYSTKEIAKIVHLKPNAIYGRMNTLRKKLKKFI